jgi:hypothetical protein
MVGDIAGSAWAQPLCPPVRNRAWRSRQLGRCRYRRTWRSGRSHPASTSATAVWQRPSTRPNASSVCRHRFGRRTCRQSSSQTRTSRFANCCQATVRRLEAARRHHWRQPICASRGITRIDDLPALRFHPRCYYRPNEDDVPEHPAAFPALIASVTDDQMVCRRARIALGSIHRRHEGSKVASPRRAMGNILGNAIRFGTTNDVMIAGEGIETVLSLARSSADHADGCRNLVGPSRRHPVPADTSAPLCRARPGCGRRRGVCDPDRPCTGSRDRTGVAHA